MNEQVRQDNEAWPAVSILVLNWNGRDLLQRYLPALAQQQYPGRYEIVLIDNGSTDDSLLFAAAHFPQVLRIANGENLGFSRGINEGLRQAAAEITVLLNTDVEVRANWLLELVRPLRADPGIGITGSKLYFPDGVTLQHAGAMVEYPTAVGRHRFYRQPDTGQADDLCDVDYVTGAAMAIRQELLFAIGLLDEAFSPFYYEEVDFCRRAWEAGFRVVYAPDSVAIHHESLLAGKMHEWQFYNLNRNRLLYVLKHFSATQIREDFIPAEHRYLQTRPHLPQVQGMQRVYRESLLRLTAFVSPLSPWAECAEGLVNLAQAAGDRRHTMTKRETKGKGMKAYQLTEKAIVRERPFSSQTPIIGALLAWFRAQWNNISTTWYVRPLLDQQNTYNQLVAQALQEMAQTMQQMAETMQQLAQDHDARLIAQDHDQVALTRQLAELTMQVKQMNHRLQVVEERLAAPE